MCLQKVFPAVLMTLVIVLGAGCTKSDSGLPPAPANSPALTPDTIVRVHWLGKEASNSGWAHTI